MSETLQFDTQDEGEPPSQQLSPDLLYLWDRRPWSMLRDHDEFASLREYQQLQVYLRTKQTQEDVDTDAIEVQRSEALRQNPDPQPPQETISRLSRFSKVKKYVGKIAAHLSFHKTGVHQ